MDQSKMMAVARQSFEKFDAVLKESKTFDEQTLRQLFDEFCLQYDIAKSLESLGTDLTCSEKATSLERLILQKCEEYKSSLAEARSSYVSFKNVLKKVDKYRPPIQQDIEQDKKRLETYKKKSECYALAQGLVESFVKKYGLKSENGLGEPDRK